MSNNLYIRYQGRVSGPFPLEKVQDMLKRGQISRLHQVSPDRAVWTRVMENAELVPPPPPPPPVVAPQAELITQSAASAGGASPRMGQPATRPDADPLDQLAAASRREWYYESKQGGQAGPVSEMRLKMLLKSGEISAKTMVWSEGMQDWMMMADAGLVGGKQVERIKDNSGMQAVVFSCIGAAIMLLAVVGLVMNVRNATGAQITLCVVHLLLFIAAAIVAGMLKSKARGITLLSIAGFAVVLSGIGLLLFFPCMALLQGNLAYRLKSPKRPASRVFGIVASSVNLFLFVVVGLILLASWGEVLSQAEGRVAVGATFVILFISIPAICGILGSVFALVDVIQDGNKGMNIAAQVLLSCTLIVPAGILAVAIGAGAANLGGQVGMAGVILVLTIVCVAVFYGCQLALLRLGLVSLLRGTEPDEEEWVAEERSESASAHHSAVRSRLTSAIYCRGCGREIHATAQTCPHCGAPQKAQVEPASL